MSRKIKRAERSPKSKPLHKYNEHRKGNQGTKTSSAKDQSFTRLPGDKHRINLFEDSEEIINLYQAMDKMRQRYGAGAVQRAIGTGLNLRRFNPFNGLKS